MNKEVHKLAKDGILSDGVSHHEASAQHLATFDRAQDALKNFHSPIFLSEGNPHRRIFIAAFDGTGNDAIHDPLHSTNVADIASKVRSLGNNRIAVEYLPGPGTQEDLLSRTWDGATGYTHDRRAEHMYKSFTDRAKHWLDEDPQAEICVVAIGFSRGAEIATQFTRLVHERGIQNPDDASHEYGSDHLVRSSTYTQPPLVPPGQVPQAVGLFDPVNTGRAEERDRRLPPSVVSGFQIIAADERRNQFKADHIIDPGLSPDGRFLGISVAGAHSDIGGSYHRHGLAMRSNHLMKDYLNSLSDQPFLQKKLEPDEPHMNVVHHSEEGLWLYRLDRKIDRQSPQGHNKLLVPRSQIDNVVNPYDPEARDETLTDRFERQAVRSGARTQGLRDAPASTITRHNSPQDMFKAISEAVLRGDDETCMQIGRAYAQSEWGQALRAQAQAHLRQETLDQQARATVTCDNPVQPEPSARRAPSMRH